MYIVIIITYPLRMLSASFIECDLFSRIHNQYDMWMGGGREISQLSIDDWVLVNDCIWNLTSFCLNDERFIFNVLFFDLYFECMLSSKFIAARTQSYITWSLIHSQWQTKELIYLVNLDHLCYSLWNYM